MKSYVLEVLRDGWHSTGRKKYINEQDFEIRVVGEDTKAMPKTIVSVAQDGFTQKWKSSRIIRATFDMDQPLLCIVHNKPHMATGFELVTVTNKLDAEQEQYACEINEENRPKRLLAHVYKVFSGTLIMDETTGAWVIRIDYDSRVPIQNQALAEALTKERLQEDKQKYERDLLLEREAIKKEILVRKRELAELDERERVLEAEIAKRPHLGRE